MGARRFEEDPTCRAHPRPSTAPIPRARSPPRRSAAPTGAAGAPTTCWAPSTSSTRPSAGEGAALVRRGVSFSLAQSLRHRRPAEGLAAADQPGAHDARHRPGRRARAGLPARPRRRRRRGVHAAAGLDPVGRPRAHLRPRHRLERPARRRRGDQRGRPGHRHRDRRRPDRRPRRAARRRPRARRRTASCPTGSRSPPSTSRRRSPRRARSSRVGRGDLVLVRTGRLGPGPRRRLGRLRRRRRRPGLSFTTADWLHGTRDRRRSPPTPGASRCGPTSSTTRSSRCTRSPSRTSGCSSARCGTSTRWPRTAPPTASTSSCSIAAPLPVTGAVGAPGQPHRRQVTSKEPTMPAVDAPSWSSAAAPPAPPPRSCSPRPASPSTSSRSSRTSPRVGSGITLQGNALRVLRDLGVWEQVARRGLRLRQPRHPRARPGRHAGRGDPRRPHRRPRPAGDGRACRARTWPGSCSTAPPRSASKIRFGTTAADLRQDDAGVDVTFSDGVRRPLRPGDRRRRGPLVDPPRARHRAGDRDRRAWASGGPFGPRPASVTRTDLYYGGPSLHRRLLPDRRGLALRLHRRGRPGPLRR